MWRYSPARADANGTLYHDDTQAYKPPYEVPRDPDYSNYIPDVVTPTRRTKVS